LYIGAHISIGKGYTQALITAEKIGANTMQFFTRNPRGAKAKALNPVDAQQYIEDVEKLGFGSALAHSPYIINMASPSDDLWQLAVKLITEDMERLQSLNVPYLCLHPGSHVGSGIQAGIDRICTALNQAFSSTDSQVMVLLETMAGSGTEIGSSFEELRLIMEGCRYPERIGICFDTCHVYAAGYDIKENLDDVLQHFDNCLGINTLKAIHLNDSQQALGTKKDRHACIGEGFLGETFFKEFVRHSAFKNLPLILETPGGLEGYKKEIKLLKNQ